MQFTAMIVQNREVSPGYFLMRMTAPQELLDAEPGQFVMVRVRDGIDPLLRRPFGIYDVGEFTPPFSGAAPQPYLEILFKVVGKGTGMLATLHQGDQLDILAPLGTGFTAGPENEEKILVGGGVGLAPLYYLARRLVATSKVRLFIGGRNRDDLLCITEFERLGVETYVATDDGSLGERGFVTEVLDKELSRRGGSIFACGPGPMLKAVAAIADRHNVHCQVSLEAYMACGVGACLGCVTKGKEHAEGHPDYRCVC
ncbi:MAG TPA: dihydroorotate dehydrogenase electron transfer subunit, partial [Geobacterales bacterium]|nr:dihydroorotate dehydrogenase electron transfer subunit [Geobacterales bacterium]